jgi:acyl-CoA hydrolase
VQQYRQQTATGVATGATRRDPAERISRSMAVEPISLPVASSEATIQRVADTLRANHLEVLVVDTGDQARDAVLERVPEGSEVYTGKSMTLEEIGVFAALHEPGRYDAIRPKLQAMDRATQGREMRKLGQVPDTIVGSVAALTEDGWLVAASATGNQLAAYAAGAGRVILVVGSQKIVPDLDAALERIHEVVFPYEDARVRSTLGVGTKLEKVLLLRGEWAEGRTTVILVREPVGV